MTHNENSRKNLTLVLRNFQDNNWTPGKFGGFLRTTAKS